MPVPTPSSSPSFLAAQSHQHHIGARSRTASGNKGKTSASDVFRPNLPLDPFAHLPKQPIRIPTEAIFALSISEPARDVVLALGDPSAAHLEPLFLSQHLAFSLLIIASHEPPAIPHGVIPAVRILRLTEPLDLEHAGAVRLVNVFEWAERVSRTWRKHGGIGVRILDEQDLGALAPPPAFRSRTGSSASSLRSAKDHKRESASVPASPRASTVNLTQSSSSASFRMLRKNTDRALPAADPSQRPFDALVHCISPNTGDTAMLKQAILVTTVSRPFLVAAVPASPQSAPTSRTSTLFGRRPSNLRGSMHSLYSMPPTPPMSSGESLSSLSPSPMAPSTRQAHLIHLLATPPPRSAHRVLRSIESFLLSFSSPTALDMPISSSSGSTRPRPSNLVPARAFLLDAQAFAAPLSLPPDLGLPPDWSVADTLLGGCADDDLAGSLPGLANSPFANANANEMPRAWLLGARDLIVVPSTLSPSPPELSEPPRAMNRTRHTSYASAEQGQGQGSPMSGLSESGAPSMPRVLRRLSTPTSAPPSRLSKKGSQLGGLPAFDTHPKGSRGAGGLPTPPDSEEEALSGGLAGAPVSPESRSRSASTSLLVSSSSSAPLPGGRVEKKRRRWQFWK